MSAPERIWAHREHNDETWKYGTFWTSYHDSAGITQEYVRADLCTPTDERVQALEAENARLRYVLGGVRGAIKTGRNEPLVIWAEQIDIALDTRAALRDMEGGK